MRKSSGEKRLNNSARRREKERHGDGPRALARSSLLRDWFFPGGLDGKESACNLGDLGLIPGLGGSPGEENVYARQYTCLENPMDRRMPGSSSGGSREFEAGTVSARIRKQLLN